jgi:hypothetical protein
MALGLAGSAGATTIGFDSALGGNPHGIYEEDGYSFTPNSGTNGNCPVPTDAPCLKELTQGEITTMTQTAGGLFDLLGFDFVLVGSGNNPNNPNNTSSMIVTGHLNPAVSFEIKLGDALGTFTNYILTTVSGVSTGNVTFNQGYRVSFLNGLFDGVGMVEFTTVETIVCDPGSKKKCVPGTSGGNAQARIDNIVVPDPVEPPPVPVPAAGWMLVAGLGGLAALRRRRTAA